VLTHINSVRSVNKNNFMGKNIGIVSSCLPRKCGIATFSENLRNGLTQCADIGDVSAIALGNNGKYDYPDHVVFEIEQENLEDYYRAAKMLNASKVDAVSLQHEFGLFGGSNGSYIRVFLKQIEKPVITTFHTIPQSPSPGQREMIREIANFSQSAVIMNSLATDIMEDVYQVPRSKIRVIPHGVSLVNYQEPAFYKNQLGLQDYLLILTFGFLSPNKGIETMLQAMPDVIEECPNALYIILGMTHPVERKHNGEMYREKLEKIVEDLNINDHVLFVDRFVDDQAMDLFVGGTDIVVCPYHSQDQITSGVLSTALSRGKAIVSTPNLHAKEVLTAQRGLLVPPKDPASMAEAVIRLGKNENERVRFGSDVYEYSRQLGWDQVSMQYSRMLNNAEIRPGSIPYRNVKASF
jgi:glycosyltransferase involved in cell wall biosynthesis